MTTKRQDLNLPVNYDLNDSLAESCAIESRVMISWQVQIGGRTPTDWDPKRDDRWFPDFGYQEFLLPYFDVGESPIDPYGHTELHDADLQRLREHLRNAEGLFEAKPGKWSLTESSEGKSRTIEFERETILALIGGTLEMIELALARGGAIVFLGD